MKQLTTALSLLSFTLLGFGSAHAENSAAARTQKRTVAVTIDDLPAIDDDISLSALQSATAKLAEAIRTRGVPTVGFVNEYKLELDKHRGEREQLLRVWRDAGIELGNHTYSHESPNKLGVKQYEADILRGEKVTQKILAEKGLHIRYFRHPFLETGPTLAARHQIETFLSEHHYTIAPVTVMSYEWAFSQLYDDALRRRDEAVMKTVRELYVPYLESVFEFFEGASKQVLGYEVPQIFLLHAGTLNAEKFGEITDMLEHRGYTFVSLDEAMRDPAYSMEDIYASKEGTSWFVHWAKSRHLPELEIPIEVDEPAAVKRLAKRYLKD
ncbi:MAG: polysaccharide deacetylase family protein [Bdellovibrionota bacterium]